MYVLCTVGFYKEINSLKKNKSYKSIEMDVFSVLFNSTLESIKAGSTKLTGTPIQPFLKKRINGSSGYRLYLLLQIVEDKIMLSFIHPKTGSSGAENISDKAKTQFFDDAVDALKNGPYYKVDFNGSEATYTLYE